MTAEAELRVAEPEDGGRLADRYIVGRLLGTGATAEVRSGWDCRLERPVAIKLLRPELASDPAIRHRFAEEARAAARLSHPNVVAVFDTGDPDGEGPPYIVMERLPGETLRRVLESGPLPVAAAHDLAVQMLSALRAGAAAGLVHCDIKPGNILVTTDGRWKLADFGIARSIGIAAVDDTAGVAGGPEDTVAGLVMGTPAYLPPERLYGQAATESSDVFSLGVVLYEALTGRRPYRTTDAFPWSTALSGRPAEPVRSVRAGIPPVLAAAVDRAVRLDPALRFASAQEMAAALDAVPRRRGAFRLLEMSGPRRALTGALAGAAALVTALLLLMAGTSAPPAPAGPAGDAGAQPAASAAPTAAAPAGGATAGTAPTTVAPVNAVPAQASIPAASTSPAGPPPAPARAPGAKAPGPATRHGKGPGPHHKGPAGG